MNTSKGPSSAKRVAQFHRAGAFQCSVAFVPLVKAHRCNSVFFWIRLTEKTDFGSGALCKQGVTSKISLEVKRRKVSARWQPQFTDAAVV